jgi:hypothetical protein
MWTFSTIAYFASLTPARGCDKHQKVYMQSRSGPKLTNDQIESDQLLRDEKGRDVFWKCENGMSHTEFADAALSNELMRVMAGAVERLILDKDIIPKNLCRKESRYPLHLQPMDKEKFGSLYLRVWANWYKTLRGMSV